MGKLTFRTPLFKATFPGSPAGSNFAFSRADIQLVWLAGGCEPLSPRSPALQVCVYHRAEGDMFTALQQETRNGFLSKKEML